MLTGKPCTCEGSNPNCYKCYGTGLITPPPPPSPPGIPVPTVNNSPRKSRRKSKTAKYKVMTCLCGGCHQCKLGALSGVSLNTRSPDYVKCPECGVDVKHLKKHLQKMHSQPPMVATERTVAHSAQQGRLTAPHGIVCSLCGAVVSTAKTLKMHANQVHSGYLVAATRRLDNVKTSIRCKPIDALKRDSKNKSLATVRPKYAEDKQYSKANHQPQRESMDATYGAGGSFRDHGQFGSAPSYDNMDDESWS